MSEFELFLALAILTALAALLNLKALNSTVLRMFTYAVILVSFPVAVGMVISNLLSRLL